MRKRISAVQKARQDELIATYQKYLQDAVALFYEQVGDDEEENERQFDSFNLGWKRLASEANRTQKHTRIDIFAFEKQIEQYKQIALQRVISQQENGHDQNETNSNRTTGAEQGTDSGTTKEPEINQGQPV